MIQAYKLQIGCIILFGYIVFHYLNERKRLQEETRRHIFDILLFVCGIYYISDILTVYTVNHLESVPGYINVIGHLIFLSSIDIFVFLAFIYILKITEAYPVSKKGKIWLWMPFVINFAILIGNIGNLQYVEGIATNYSMGVSAYTCFSMSAVYVVATAVTFFWRWNYIEYHKRAGIVAYLGILAVVTFVQMLYPEVLITSIAVTMIILGIYLNMENPVMKKLTYYQEEMVQGFAGMMEYKDDNTGGHIHRTTTYVELLARELRRRGEYRHILTKDYINNLRKAAPMHDIGKIAIPDSILQKPGKLTEEEFEQMKKHAETGGEIIRRTMQNIGDKEYYYMAYQVAKYHHERWDGSGYPEGLDADEIPLCARIMAVADVFDAISQKRCYRDAMPLKQCFAIMEEGRGIDFEPVLVDAFLACREEVTKVCMCFREEIDDASAP